MKVIVKTEIVFVPYSRFRHAIDQYCMHVHCTTTGLFFKWNPFNLGFLCQQAKIGWGCKLKQVFICWSNYMYQHFIYFVFSSLLKRHLTFVREGLKKVIFITFLKKIFFVLALNQSNHIGIGLWKEMSYVCQRVSIDICTYIRYLVSKGPDNTPSAKDS